MNCCLIVHKCADCKQEFIGSWQEWYCQKCKDKRNLLSNTYYKKIGRKINMSIAETTQDATNHGH